jgi:hypothetical protein
VSYLPHHYPVFRERLKGRVGECGDINTALHTTIIQVIEGNLFNKLLFITMDMVRATSLNSKISQFLHCIPGTTTVHLDSPLIQFLLHGILTTQSLAKIGRELITFNTGLAPHQQP